MSGLESHGADMARRFQSEAPPLPLNDPRVQVYLAKLAYPRSEKPMEKWIAGAEEGKKLAPRVQYRNYIERKKLDDTYPTIDVTDTEALKVILKEMKGNDTQKLH